MQAIETKCHPPTSTHNARISATPGSGHGRIYIDVPDNMHADDQATHMLAAIALADKLAWAGRLVGGATSRGYVFVFAE